MPSLHQSKTESLRPRGLREIAPLYDVVFCDVWGVVHDGRRAFTDSCDALRRFREGGGAVVLLTNAPRPRAPILSQLARLGAPASGFDALVTSGDVTLAYIAQRGEAPFHHIGPARDLALFEALAAQTGLSPARVGLEAAQYVVCTGLDDDERETPDDYAQRLAFAREKDLDLICANPDLVVHVGDRLIYCAGALAAAYEKLGGRVLQAGKPHAPIYERALSEARALLGRPVERRRILAIGDAMRTDVRGACAFGLDSLFITSGIHREELHPSGELSLDSAAVAQFLGASDVRPTYVAARLFW